MIRRLATATLALFLGSCASTTHDLEEIQVIRIDGGRAEIGGAIEDVGNCSNDSFHCYIGKSFAFSFPKHCKEELFASGWGYIDVIMEPISGPLISSNLHSQFGSINYSLESSINYTEMRVSIYRSSKNREGYARLGRVVLNSPESIGPNQKFIEVDGSPLWCGLS